MAAHEPFQRRVVALGDGPHGVGRMRNEQQRYAGVEQLAQAGDALLLEARVTDRENLIENICNLSFDAGEITNSNTATAVGTNAQFIYEDDANALWFDSNGTGAGGLTLVATFSNSAVLNGLLANDFDFIL